MPPNAGQRSPASYSTDRHLVIVNGAAFIVEDQWAWAGRFARRSPEASHRVVASALRRLRPRLRLRPRRRFGLGA
jgi:hypothetical protein